MQQRKDAEKQAAEKEAERIAKEKAGTGLAAQSTEHQTAVSHALRFSTASATCVQTRNGLRCLQSNGHVSKTGWPCARSSKNESVPATLAMPGGQRVAPNRLPALATRHQCFLSQNHQPTSFQRHRRDAFPRLRCHIVRASLRLMRLAQLRPASLIRRCKAGFEGCLRPRNQRVQHVVGRRRKALASHARRLLRWMPLDQRQQHSQPARCQQEFDACHNQQLLNCKRRNPANPLFQCACCRHPRQPPRWRQCRYGRRCKLRHRQNGPQLDRHKRSLQRQLKLPPC